MTPLLAGLAIAVAAVAFAPQASASLPLTTGITTPDSDSTSQLGYDRIKQAGASFTRISAWWYDVAPSKKPADWDPTDPSDPKYNWSSIDDQAKKAVAAGLTPMIQIWGAPSWAERCNSKGEPHICNPDPNDFAQFTQAAVKRYSGNFGGLPKIHYWEPWNEPNLHIYLEPQKVGSKRPSPTIYRTMLNQFANVVKSADPNNLVVAGGLAPLGGVGSTGPLDFARRMLCMQGLAKPKPIKGCAGKARFDIFAMNPYTTGGPTRSAVSPDDVQMGDLAELNRLIKAAKRYGKIQTPRASVPLWVTEFSWDSKPPDPKGLPMGILCRWTSEAIYRAWKAGVVNFFWLSIRDWQRDTNAPYDQTIESGLWFRGGDGVETDKPKRVLKAFRYPFVAFRTNRGILIWGRTPTSKPGKVTIKFGSRAGAVNQRIKVVKANKYGLFQALVRTKLGSNKRGFVTATQGKEISLPFSLKPVKDFRHPPFGG